MKKILIINNHSKYLVNLIKEVGDAKIIDFEKINYLNEKFDYIILSGGNFLAVKNHKKEYSKEIEIIKKSKVPILGICLGFELINFTFGEKLAKESKWIKGKKEIRIVSSEKIFVGVPEKFKVYEKHRWIVKKNTFLKTLAVSANYVEAVKHPTKEIYGVQFHPEKMNNKINKKIIKNFLEI